jgi:hypothetical protein
LLQSYSDKPSEEVREALSQYFDASALTPERARMLSELTKRKERRENDEFIRQLIGDLRKVVRDARRQNMHVAVLIDPIDADTLRGTPLQRTLLRARRHIRNLARYEGAEFRLLRSSGKQCPICGSWGVEVAPRTYQCTKCGITWDRDRSAVLRPAVALPGAAGEHARGERRREIRGGQAGSKVQRLHEEAPRFPLKLSRSPVERGTANAGPQATGAPARGTEEGVKLGNGQTP